MQFTMKLTWKNFQTILLLIINFLIVGLLSTANSRSNYVPLNHWVYQFIERLETKQIIRGVLNDTRPLSRREIADYLVQLHEKIDQLNQVEQEQLNFLNIEFKEELKELSGHLNHYQTRIQRIRENHIGKKLIPRIIYRNNRNFLSWEQDQFQVFVDPTFYHHRIYNETDSLSFTEKVFQFTNGLRIWGNIGDHLGFFVDARDNKEWGTRNYRIGNYTLPRLGFVRATSPDFIYHDETEAYLQLGFKFIDLTYGKFKNDWGPGYTGSLMLSDYATSYDQLKLEIKQKQFKFSSIYAYLIDYRDFKGDSLQPRKYLAGHRIEFLPWHWLGLGISETVIFKGRNFEPAYLNPVMFFRSAEHYLGSPDNMMMSLEFKCTVIRNFKFYGELLIDDITTTKLGTDWHGNKLGCLGGFFYVDVLGLPNSDLRIEYARIRPYVYSHADGINYTHYGSALGYWCEPNSENFYSEFGYRFSKHLVTTVFFQFNRHGANPPDKNVGGDINRPIGLTDDLYVGFLEGIVEKRQSAGFDFSYEIFENCYFRFGYRHHDSNNILDANTLRQRIEGDEFIFSIGLNY